ncbi:MAG TPA: hypothetical protein VIJ17_14200, partial [Pseudolabrys sp.]
RPRSAAENGDGQGFGTEDGRAHLSTRNVESDTPANYVQKYVDRQGITYKRATARFYISMTVATISSTVLP